MACRAVASAQAGPLGLDSLLCPSHLGDMMQSHFFRKEIAFLVVFVSVLCSSPPSVRAWRQLDEGLWLGKFNWPDELSDEDPKVRVLKIDPKVYDFRLLSTSEHNTGPMTAEEWADRFDLVAVINSSMYQVNRITSTGYMRNFAHVNNPKINPRFGAFLVFNPVDTSVPPVQIIDKNYQGWTKLIHKYNTVIQNYRMISAKQENLWSQTDRRHNIACVGIDKEGNVLFIHSSQSYSVYEFNQALLRIPLNIYNAMFVEGGSEAFLYLNTRKLPSKLRRTDNNWPVYDLNHKLPPAPNVLGIIRRQERTNRGLP